MCSSDLEKQDELVVLAMPWAASLEEYPAMRALDKELDLAAGVSVHFGKTVSMLHSHPGYDGDAARRARGLRQWRRRRALGASTWRWGWRHLARRYSTGRLRCSVLCR